MSIRSFIFKQPATLIDVANILRKSGKPDADVTIAREIVLLDNYDATGLAETVIVKGEGVDYFNAGRIFYTDSALIPEYANSVENRILMKALKAAHNLEAQGLNVKLQGKPMDEVRRELGLGRNIRELR